MSAALSNTHQVPLAAPVPASDRWPACRGVLFIAGLSGGMWWGAWRVIGWVLS